MQATNSFFGRLISHISVRPTMMNVGATPICCWCPAEGGGSHREFRRSISGRQPSGSNGATFAALPLSPRRSACLPVCESVPRGYQAGRMQKIGLNLLCLSAVQVSPVRDCCCHFSCCPVPFTTHGPISSQPVPSFHATLEETATIGLLLHSKKQFRKASTSRSTLFQLDSTYLLDEFNK